VRAPWVTLLVGSEWEELGRIGVAAHDDRLAIALSRGLHPKGYPYVDPNEDAVVGAADDDARLVAVLDGHRGFDAAEAAAAAVVAWTPDLLAGGEVHDALHAAHEAVVRAVASREDERAGSRTALTLAVARDGRLEHATWGDTSLLLVRGRRAEVLSRPVEFLGPGSRVPRVVRTRLRARDRLVAVSDGLTTFAGRDWPSLVAARTTGRPAEDACMDLISAAGDLGAGDNVAVAVLDP
jgi:hypothetical protein